MNCNDPSLAPTATCQGQEFEVARIPKASTVCPMCEDYADRQASKPVAVMCCEGACLRGEIARQAANILCHSLLPEQTVRVCLGGAFTKNTGQRGLVRNAPRLLAVEGCSISCATRMMHGVIEGLKPETIITDAMIDFDRNLFGIEEMPEARIRELARSVAEQLARRLAGNESPCSARSCCGA